MAYIRCPRCELNYIDKKDKFCNVCKQEMKANGDTIYEDMEMELCPICHFNLINHDQDMCDSCKEELGADMFSEETAREWRKYIGEDDGDEDLTDEELEQESIGDDASIVEISDEDLGLGIDEDEITAELDKEIEQDINDDMADEDFDVFDDDFDDEEYDDDDDK
ncbi:MAG: hypothetical protein ACI4TX_01515 [Christensenellales bacterium]